MPEQASTTLGKDGSWPLYAAPYKGGGVALGWMKFGTVPADGFDGAAGIVRETRSG